MTLKGGQIPPHGRSVCDCRGAIEQTGGHDQIISKVKIDVFKDLPHQEPSVTLEGQDQSKVQWEVKKCPYLLPDGSKTVVFDLMEV